MKTILTMLLLLTIYKANAIVYRHDADVKKHKAKAAEPQFDCVGAVYHNMELAGSCVLIDKKYVLTAIHVFVESDTREVKYQMGDKEVTVYENLNEHVGDITKYSFDFAGKRYQGKSIKYFPEYMDSITKGQYDIALIELNSDVVNVQPALLNKDINEVGKTASIVGFGASGIAYPIDSVDDHSLKLAGENTIDTTRGAQYNERYTLLSADFDHPGKKELNIYGSNVPLELECSTAGGDSGGGLFIQASGKWQLAGITIGGGLTMERLLTDGYYGSAFDFTKVSAFYNWIKENMR